MSCVIRNCTPTEPSLPTRALPTILMEGSIRLHSMILESRHTEYLQGLMGAACWYQMREVLLLTSIAWMDVGMPTLSSKRTDGIVGDEPRYLTLTYSAAGYLVH
jgi:hypothetical protein